ncbi:MAG: methyltransferase domain-containing protein [Acidimicrobiia bacterium]
MATTGIDEKKAEEFVGRVLTDTSAAMITTLCALGDRLGLFRDLADNGPATSAQLAERAGINERYAREWLSALAATGYLTYDPATGVFTLPAEHVPALAQEAGPYFFGGVHQMLTGISGALDPLVEAFRSGGGVPQSRYGADWWDGMERFTAAWVENLLVQEWVPLVPDVKAKLEAGATVADVGCGRGRALVKLAQTFPNSTFVGYDVFGPSVEAATAKTKAAGVDDRVRFEERDVSGGLPERFDVIWTLDVIHDAVDPVGVLRAIRDALTDDGIYLCLDINCSDKLEENAGPLGAMFLSFSVLYCMTTSLAHDGAGLGTVGLHEPKLRELAAEAGFGAVRRVEMENPFNNLYELRR